MSFDYNYEVKDWKERKSLVEEYEAENTIVYDIHELKLKNTKEKINKNGEKFYYEEQTEQLRNLLFELKRLYDYILYAKDKSIEKQDKQRNKNDKKRKKMLIDEVQGIKSFYAPKRGTKYKEVRWYNGESNHRSYVIDNLKRYAESRELINIIEEQQYNYKEFINKEIKTKNAAWFNKHSFVIDGKDTKLRKMNVLTSVYNDINDCEKGIENISKVNVKEGIRMGRDKLNGVEIEYNKTTIRCILNNWDLVKEESFRNPSYVIHDIYMDVDGALKKVKLTDKELDVLCNVFNKKPINWSDYGFYDSIIDKILCKLLFKK